MLQRRISAKGEILLIPAVVMLCSECGKDAVVVVVFASGNNQSSLPIHSLHQKAPIPRNSLQGLANVEIIMSTSMVISNRCRSLIPTWLWLACVQWSVVLWCPPVLPALIPARRVAIIGRLDWFSERMNWSELILPEVGWSVLRSL
jgi:hypothetical protein